MKKNKLSFKDKISLQSISGGIAGDDSFYHKYLVGKKTLSSIWNFQITEGKHSLMGSKFIKNNPQKRAGDFMEAILDNEIKAIFANIGGFDSHALYEHLDFSKIKENPTLVFGYSDITSIHFMLYKIGIQSFYSPTILDGFAENGGMHEWTKSSFEDLVLHGKEIVISEASPEWTSEFLDWSNKDFDYVKRKMNSESYGHIYLNWENIDIAKGKLLGGCLDTIIQIKNQEFFPDIEEWKNTIMFLETSELKMTPKIFENSLNKLKKEINNTNAIIFGKPKDEKYFKEYLEIIKKVVTNKPVIYNMNFGHTAPFTTFPYGGKMTINSKTEIIKIKR